jgi:anaerobic magnesium-protoporphyrin IX monomethyl ester cyclase
MQPDPSIDVLVIEDLGQQRLPARRLVAVLRRAGMSAQLVHFGPGDDPGSILALARRERPRLIVLSILFAHLVAENMSLTTYLRAAGVTAHMTMAGPLPTFAYSELLEACPALDSVLCGEAEASLAQLATGLRGLEDWHSAPGLAYRSPTLRTNPLPQPVSDLDELPFPARDDGISTRLGFGFVTLEASRGCYHACAFCLPCALYRAHTAHAYRLRSIPNLVAEIDALYQHGVRLFLFDDEQFLAPGRWRTQRIQALADQLERRGLDIAFSIKCRADDVDEVLFRQLKAMGLVRVYLGIESGCQASLNLLDKGVTADCNARALALLDKLGIVADFRCLLFHPWSTLEMIQADIEFLEQVLPHVSTPFTFYEVECYPGTPLSRRLRAEEPGPEERRKDAPWPSADGNFERFDKDFRLAYTIADRRAELLRRLGRVVFGARNVDGGVPSQISQAWYDILLKRRFHAEWVTTGEALTLKDIATRLNRESLAVWREMLAFAGEGDLYDAGHVNEHASAWASRVNAFDLTIEEELF